MSVMVKAEYIIGLIVLMDLNKEDAKQLSKLSVSVLERMFEGLQRNAIAYKDLEDDNK
jgi:hypothetical protein